MFEGFYVNQSGRPMVIGRFIYTNIDESQDVPFIVDTGADCTSIGRVDAVRIGLMPEDLPEDTHITEFRSRGIGGSATTYRIHGSIALGFEQQSEESDTESLHVEFLDSIDVVPDIDQNLLGRDVIDRFDVLFSRVSGEINFERNTSAKGSYMVFQM